MAPAHASLIISSYNQPRALALVLQGVARQTRMPDEIIIADDGSSGPTFRVIEDLRLRFNLPIRAVVTQEDRGFRKGMALNRAVLRSTGQLLLFLDGDVVPPPHWLERHAATYRPMGYAAGTYLRLDLKQSEDVERKGLVNLQWEQYLSASERRRWRIKAAKARLHILLRRRTRPKLWGGNFSVDRGLFFGINGFDERMNDFGGVDSELRNRMNNVGGKPRSLITQAFCLHINEGLDADPNRPPGTRNRGLTHDGPYMSLSRSRWAEIGLTSHAAELDQASQRHRAMGSPTKVESIEAIVLR